MWKFFSQSIRWKHLQFFVGPRKKEVVLLASASILHGRLSIQKLNIKSTKKKINGSWKLYQGLQKTQKSFYFIFENWAETTRTKRNVGNKKVLQHFMQGSGSKFFKASSKMHQTYFFLLSWLERKEIPGVINCDVNVRFGLQRQKTAAAGKMINQNWRIIRWNQRSLCQD